MNRGNYLTANPPSPLNYPSKLVTKWQGNIGNSLPQELVAVCDAAIAYTSGSCWEEGGVGTRLTISVKLFFVRRGGSFVPTSGPSQEGTWFPRVYQG